MACEQTKNMTRIARRPNAHENTRTIEDRDRRKEEGGKEWDMSKLKKKKKTGFNNRYNSNGAPNGLVQTK